MYYCSIQPQQSPLPFKRDSNFFKTMWICYFSGACSCLFRGIQVKRVSINANFSGMRVYQKGKPKANGILEVENLLLPTSQSILINVIQNEQKLINKLSQNLYFIQFPLKNKSKLKSLLIIQVFDFFHLSSLQLHQYFMRSHQSDRYERQHSSSSSPKHRDDRSEQPLVRFKLEETRTLMIQNAQDVLAEIQAKFTDLSINIGTSVPDEVEVQSKNIYVRYPSIQAATAVFEHLKGQITIDSRQLKLQYYPIRRVDLTLAYDWYCDKCDYKNFARRNKCYRCESLKSVDCRLSYSTQPSSRNFKEESAQNCSLMIRGPIVGQVQQNVLLQTFEAMVPVRDIRQIKNKLTGKFKDFAFVQFFSPEETAQAYKLANESTFRIAGQRVTVMYSRNKSDDDYFKPLPYEAGKREKKTKERPQQQDNYYHRQRQRQIEEQKARPSITMQQLKQKRQQQLKKQQQAIVPKEMNQQQSKRRAAQQLAKQWQREMKVQAVMYVCPACCRKFASAQQMKVHEKMSKLHAYNMQKISSVSLAI